MPTKFIPTHIVDFEGHPRNGHTCEVLFMTGGSSYGDGVYQVRFSDDALFALPTKHVPRIQNPESPNRNYKPDHYHSGGIDPWQFIEANMNTQQAIGFHLGNVLKYVARHEKKNGLEDLKKALDSLREGIRLYEKGRIEADS